MTETTKTHVILLSCGSFNPITKGHIHMFGLLLFGCSEIAGQGGGAPEIAGQGGGAPEIAVQGRGAPEIAGQGGGAPEIAGQGGGAPEIAGQGGGAPEIAGQGGGAPEIAGQGGGAPEIAGQGGGAPEIAGQGGGAPEIAGQGGGAPEIAGQGGFVTEEPLENLCWGEVLILEHPHTVPADGAVGVEVEGHQAFWTCDDKPFISVLNTVPPHTDSLGVSTKTKAGLVTEDDPLPF
ncbi:hypothetical protein NFI96_023210 [Prochilodus magdalenae]|nr:hypothetical protein NFI96_023210 [Prochilodus magdalenae]